MGKKLYKVSVTMETMVVAKDKSSAIKTFHDIENIVEREGVFNEKADLALSISSLPIGWERSNIPWGFESWESELSVGQIITLGGEIPDEPGYETNNETVKGENNESLDDFLESFRPLYEKLKEKFETNE